MVSVQVIGDGAAMQHSARSLSRSNVLLSEQTAKFKRVVACRHVVASFSITANVLLEEESIIRFTAMIGGVGCQETPGAGWIEVLEVLLRLASGMVV